MKKNLRIAFRLVFMAFITASVFSACVPQKKMMYMQMAEQTEIRPSYENDRSISYSIQPGDNLYIKVVSLDEKTSMIFNGSGGGNSQQLASDASVYLNSYTVSDVGTIEFPLAGQIYVQNLNIEQIKERIQETLDEYLKETVLIVRLVNFNVTVLGEVRRPGQYKVYQSEINIFEILSMSGDLTEFAKRSDIKIVRQTKSGSEVITVDLERADILSSDYYYLKPNDIIYVEPLKIKQYGFATFPYALVFSSISTALLLINFFN